MNVDKVDIARIEGKERGTEITAFRKQYSARTTGEFPDELVLRLRKEWDLKYGENPNQPAALYVLAGVQGQEVGRVAERTNIESVRSDGRGKGGLSLTNTMDISRGMDALKWFAKPAVVVMKHCVVSGFAMETNEEQSIAYLFRTARDCDRRSNFGGIAVFNVPVDNETADALFELDGYFVDVIAAPDYEQGVVGKIEKASRNMRIAAFGELGCIPRYLMEGADKGDSAQNLLSIKDMPGGRVGVQGVYLTSIRRLEDCVLDPMVVDRDGVRHVVARNPTEQEGQDLLTAWYLNISGARSNGIVFVRNGVLAAMGSGQTERVGAVEQAIVKGMQKAMDREGLEYDALRGITGCEKLEDNPFKGAVCSSDGFFPKPDSIELLGQMGVTAVIQPYGSIRDADVIDAANRYNIAMPATGERCFGHF